MNIRKIGLTALAGSLVATTAIAGELSISGGAILSYKTFDGSNDATDNPTKFAMDQELSAAGSAELDNGMTVSLSHALTSTGSGSATSSITLDMGDMGVVKYSDASIGGGLNALDDIMPTAWEEVTDGTVDEVQAGMANGAGFAYSNDFGGAAVSIQYTENFTATGSDGTQVTAGAATGLGTSHSIGITYPVGDTGLTIFGGMGTEGQSDTTEIDHDTLGVKYAMGAFTVGYQVNNEDNSAASNTVAADEDLETTIAGVSFSVNDDLSISYGRHETTSTTTSALDQEIDGVSIAYSMGGMTLSAYKHDGENISNVAGTSEGTELNLAFAF
jgi:outer membrane protein OmpU